MAYIGNKPANKAIVASDLDPAVITGQTALGATPADTDEFIISDAGTLKRMDYSHIKSSAGLNLISTTTTSSAVSEIDITGMDSTYKVYKILIMKLHMANDDAGLNGRAIIGGSVETGANHPYVAHRVSAQGTPQHTVVASTDATSWKFTNGGIGNHAMEGCSGEITIFNPSQTSQFTTLAISMHYQDPTQLAGWSGGTAHYNEEPLAALTGIRFLATSGNIESAIIKLYGLS